MKRLGRISRNTCTAVAEDVIVAQKMIANLEFQANRFKRLWGKAAAKPDPVPAMPPKQIVKVNKINLQKRLINTIPSFELYHFSKNTSSLGLAFINSMTVLRSSVTRDILRITPMLPRAAIVVYTRPKLLMVNPVMKLYPIPDNKQSSGSIISNAWYHGIVILVALFSLLGGCRHFEKTEPKRYCRSSKKRTHRCQSHKHSPREHEHRR